ncbi:GTP--adenosylcobinamide-phosphateguanylyltransferase [Thermoproteus tenax]|uniref:GTP:adenosylcobinamide-phosphateguanylyltransfera se n=1 Tax=Thermoproteus tenax (strain ATCC 35583 / DSM 2078 / JCM 9277 / NBRC 100435 / Kra 1) TaxID=768679 RepID=G4RLK6_THETK|nr:GTP--adenosylcobinamide-phosphateguanylyltransferase [Thermoproteus tenax]CCC82451.1 GTP:adenosylcobinamide-phosphateguanylyltransferase [Thermoproteus tenax Kra 1]
MPQRPLGVILAGGRGSRFGDPQKCLRPVCGVPMIMRVVASLQPYVSRLVVATTRGHAAVAWLARTWDMEVIYTEGGGYERDISALLKLAPVVIASCDLPFLEPHHVAELIENDVFTSAVKDGEYIGLTWAPNGDLSKWTNMDLDVEDVDDRRKWLQLSSSCQKPTYPIVVDPRTLLPHEDVEGLLEISWAVRPVVVDVWTCTVLDGHHRLASLAARGLPVPVVPMDYASLDVFTPDGLYFDKLAVISSASRGERLGRRVTRHFYGGKHVSSLNHVEMSLGELANIAPLRCEPL